MEEGEGLGTRLRSPVFSSRVAVLVCVFAELNRRVPRPENTHAQKYDSSDSEICDSTN